MIGYCRVSTREQASGGHSLAAQRDAIAAECRRRGWALVAVESDVASGKSDKRPGWQRVLTALRAGDADVLVAVRIDRISRSLSYFSGLLEECASGKDPIGRTRSVGSGRTRRQLPPWRMVLLREGNGVDTTSEEGEVFLNMMATWARFELRRISRRVREGLAQARKQPKPGKQPIGRAPRVPLADSKLIVRLRGPARNPRRSGNQIAAELNRRKVKTPSGVPWRASTVRAAYMRATTGYARGKSRFET